MNASPLTNAGPGNSSDLKYSHYASHLPEVYVGHANRITRYAQYENMDVDSEVNAALDIIAEFCTQTNVENGTVFDVHFHEDPSDSEIETIRKQLVNWNNLNEFDKRTFKIFRNVLKYGDQVFIRDPETFEWFWVEMTKVTKVIVNESEGKKPEQYVLKDINPNFENLTATQLNYSDDFHRSGDHKQSGYIQPSNIYTSQSSSQGRFDRSVNETAVEAEHIVHCSLTEGLDANWPFGNSILENIFKVYKQKELLEDAIIIYRIQRAPERRVFYVDVGNMPAHMAMAFVERVKNEIHQKRIPNKTGGGTTIMDAAYNPLSIMEDYFFAQTAEGRGSKVEVLPGGENLGQIDDLRYFTNKMLRALRVPSSYLPTGPEDGTATYVDGRVGTAFIQEYRFNQYCMRLQNALAPTLDKEFKLFMKNKGISIDSSLFNLKFVEPQSFSTYKEIEIHAARANVFSGLEGVPYMSRRFILEKYLGWTEDEILKNERMWEEENQSGAAASTETVPGLGNVGVRSFDVDTDVSDLDVDAPTTDELEGGSPISGEENSPAGDENA